VGRDSSEVKRGSSEVKRDSMEETETETAGEGKFPGERRLGKAMERRVRKRRSWRQRRERMSHVQWLREAAMEAERLADEFPTELNEIF